MENENQVRLLMRLVFMFMMLKKLLQHQKNPYGRVKTKINIDCLLLVKFNCCEHKIEKSETKVEIGLPNNFRVIKSYPNYWGQGTVLSLKTVKKMIIRLENPLGQQISGQKSRSNIFP